MIEPTSQQLLTYISRWDLRLRFTQLALWLPRSLGIGLAVGLGVALISRLRPWLMGQEVLTVSVVAIAISIIATLLAVLIWPRPSMQKARYFDKLFGLKERNSAALELSQGAIKAPPQLTQLQMRDAVAKAAAIDPRQYLPFRWQRNEMIAILIMTIILILTVIIANPQNSLLAQQQAFKNAVTQQVQQLEQTQKNIQGNQALSDADKAALNKILNDAINQLKEPNITQPEAVAALTQAEQQLNNAQNQLSPQQQASAAKAGQALNQTQATQGVGQSLSSGDLNGAATQLQNLAQKLGAGQLTPEQKNDAANALNQAADAMSSTNSAAADALKQAAQAMQQGDDAGAQNSLNQAAKALQSQQQQNSQLPQSQAAQSAAQTANQGRQSFLQAGGFTQQGNQGSPNQQQAGQGGNNSQNGQGQQAQQSQGNNPGQQSQSSAAGQPGQAGQQTGPNGQGGQPSSSGSDGQQSGQGSPGGQGQGNSPGQTDAGGLQSSGQNGFGSDGASQQQGSQGSAGGAGQGAGGAGQDVTQGQSNGSSGQTNLNNGQQNGQVVPPENVYAPSFVGGSGGQQLSLQGDPSKSNGQDQIQTGDFSNNPTGQSTVPLSSVAGQAAVQADRAMDSDHVPGALRGVVKDYFTGLQQTTP